MTSLKALKNKIKSVQSTKKITKAMQMVSTSKLRRARAAAESGRIYTRALQDLIISLARSSYAYSSYTPLLTGRSSEVMVLLVVISSDKGLCGSFNAGIVKLTNKRIRELEAQGKNYKVLFIGKKASEILHIPKDKVLGYHYGISGRALNYFWFQGLGQSLLEQFENGVFDACELIFNDFRSVLSQVPVITRVIPTYMEDADYAVAEQIVYTIDGNESNVLNTLLYRNFVTQLYNAVLISNAAEHASRMTAMENATNNSTELVKNLSTLYNRSRQAKITKELIEIISGANF